MSLILSPQQALLIGLTYFLANTAFLGGLAYFTTWRPLVNGLIVGLILGDPFRGMFIGAAINILYLGYMSVGGTLGIGDGALAGVLGAAVGVASHSLGLGVVAGVALASLGYQLLIWRMKGASVIARWIDSAAERGDVARMQWLNIGVAQAWLFALTVLPAAALALFATSGVRWLTTTLPGPVMDGLALGGRLAPALGIALALKFVFSGRNIAFFFGGAGAMAAGVPFEALVGIGIVAMIVWSSEFRVPSPRQKVSSSESRVPSPEKDRLRALGTPNSELGTRNSLIKTFLLWQCFSHSNYSFERLQGSGLACALAPALRSRGADALKRHGGFFNTEVNFGAMIPAALLRMELRGADASDIEKTRQTLMGIVAGYGDDMTQGALLPALLSAAIGLSLSPWLGAYAVGGYVLLSGLAMLFISWRSFRAGLLHERNAATALLSNARLKALAASARSFTALALGALAANPAVLRLPIPVTEPGGFASVNAAGAVTLTLVCYGLVSKLGIKPTWIFIGLLALAVLFQIAQSA